MSESRGQKSDRLYTFGLAEQLRTGAIGTKIYKERGQFCRLGHLGRAYGCLVADTARVKNRIKSLFRSRGVSFGAGQGSPRG